VPRAVGEAARLHVLDHLAGDHEQDAVGEGARDCRSPARQSTRAAARDAPHDGQARHAEDCDAAERGLGARGVGVTARGRRVDGSGFSCFDTRAGAGVVLEVRTSPPGERGDARQSSA
jgi:hypothetical protein